MILEKSKDLKKLKRLHIKDQIQIKNLTFHEELPDLEELELITCKTLATLEGLIKLPRLHKVRIYDTAITFSEFMAQKMPTSLKTLSFQTGKSKIDAAIAQQLEALGYPLK